VPGAPAADEVNESIDRPDLGAHASSQLRGVRGIRQVADQPVRRVNGLQSAGIRSDRHDGVTRGHQGGGSGATGITGRARDNYYRHAGV
jgi:hypothetical protein